MNDPETELQRIDYMDGHDFEYWCADLLKNAGFTAITVTRGSGDQGVDIIAYKDGEKYAVQCKRFNNKLGNKPVQEVFTGGKIYGCSKSVVMTNSFFTPGAIEAAKAVNVDLWDRTVLIRLLKSSGSHYLSKWGIKKLSFRKYPLKTPGVALKIIAGFSLLLFSLMVISAKNSHDAANENNQTNTSVSIANHQLQETNLTEDYNRLGSSVECGSLMIAVRTFSFARHFGCLKNLDMAERGYIYLVVFVDVTNVSDYPQKLTLNAELIVGGQIYDHSYIENNNFLFSFAEIEPSDSLYNKAINFKIPADCQYSGSSIELRLHDEETECFFVIR